MEPGAAGSACVRAVCDSSDIFLPRFGLLSVAFASDVDLSAARFLVVLLSASFSGVTSAGLCNCRNSSDGDGSDAGESNCSDSPVEVSE